MLIISIKGPIVGYPTNLRISYLSDHKKPKPMKPRKRPSTSVWPRGCWPPSKGSWRDPCASESTSNQMKSVDQISFGSPSDLLGISFSLVSLVFEGLPGLPL